MKGTTKRTLARFQRQHETAVLLNAMSYTP